MTYIKLFFDELFSLTNEMSPYLLIGFLFAGILHVYIRKETINKYLGKRNFKSVVLASLFGIPLPLCSCGVIPTGISFYKEGSSKGATVSFLISTPQTGIDSILVTYSLLGLPFAILRPIVALFSGVFGGLLTNIIDKKRSKMQENPICSCETNEKQTQSGNKILIMLKYAFVDFLQDIAKWLIIGLVIAALISVILPDDFFTRYIGNDFLSMLIVLLASIPLYVCATASVPITAVLILKGLSPGAALVFLMAGPATNIATITVIGKSIGKSTVLSYLISIIIGAFFFGFLIDNFLPEDFFVDNIQIMQHKDLIPEWLKITFSTLLTLLLINGLLKKYNIIKRNKTISPNNKTITVKGMTCNHCKENVENNLLKTECISNVEIDLANSNVKLEGENIDLEKVKKLIDGLGYECII
jgi:uncharacterized protein